MAIEFKLPDIGEGLTEGEIVKWLVKEGDVLKEDQPMVEVMTDKANVEIPSPAAGTVQKLLAQEGEAVPVGKVIIVIGEGVQSPKSGVQRQTTAQETAKTASAPATAQARSGNGYQGALLVEDVSKVLATPATRKLARELGVDLRHVRGTGPRGRITRGDVENFQRSGGSAAIPASPVSRTTQDSFPGPREERIPLRGLRRKISEKMVKSKQTAAHFTYVDEVDMTEIVRLRALLSERKPGAKLSYLAFIVKALVPALREFPMLNASLDDEKQEILLKRYYNIGIAVSTEEGLTVPVVRNAGRLDIHQLSAEIARLSEAARAKKIGIEDLKDGTFTITSTGNIGGILATPIINHPEVAILGVHKIAKRPVVRNGQIVVRDVGHLSLSLDHRVVDGAVGAAFCNRLIQSLESPGLLALE